MSFKRTITVFLFVAIFFANIIIIPKAFASESQDGDYKYLIKDDNAIITAYEGAGGDIIIPKTLGGYSVVEIEDSAFYNNDDITGVVIPEGIVRVGAYAFYSCGNLINIELPETLINIEDGAFRYTDKLENINVADKNKIYMSIDGVLFDREGKTLMQYPSNKKGNYAIPKTVEKIGDYAFFYSEYLENIVFPDGLIQIGEYAFYSSQNLKTIEFNNVVSIGNYAFSWCFSLEKVVLSDSIKEMGKGVFADATSLNEVYISKGLNKISAETFLGCSSLSDINIPENIKAIEKYAFKRCDSLTEITIPDSVEMLGEYAFAFCGSVEIINIGKSIAAISETAFNSCDNVAKYNVSENNLYYSSKDGILFNKDKTVLLICPRVKSGEYVVPETVEKISDEAFSGCLCLTEIKLPESLKEIGAGAFSLSGILEIKIPDSVGTVGEYAFSLCDNLKTISIGSGVKTIGEKAFFYNSSLESFSVNNNNAYYSSSEGILYNRNKTVLRQCPENKTGAVIIPETVKTILNEAFSSCEGITEIRIPKGVTDIGTDAFSYCTGLQTIKIPDTVTRLKDNSFAFSENLTTVILGSGVERIDEGVFYGCSSLKTLYYNGTRTELGGVAIYANGNQILTSISIVCFGDGVKFMGANLTLRSDLSVNFAVDNTYFTDGGYTNSAIRFEVEGVITEISDYVVQGNRAVFTLSNLSPKQMGDTIYATVIATNSLGERKEYETATYSVAQYCYNQLDKSTNEKLRVLCVDVLNYGAATQEYTNYKTDELVNSALTEEETLLATKERDYEDLVNAQKLTDNNGKLASWKGGRLMLTGAITIELSFEAADIKGCYVEFNDGSILKDNELVYSGGRYIASYSGCIPANMQEEVFAVVKNKSGEVVSGTITYSIESYARSKWNDSNVALRNLVKAMIAYGDAVKAYAA